jgi:hypothetical protein
MRIKNVLVTASLVLVAASATACSGGSKTTSSDPAANNVLPSASGADKGVGAIPGTAQAATKTFDVCTGLTAADASRITGTKFTKTKASDTEDLIFDCEYTGPGFSLLQISVAPTGGKIGYDADIAAMKGVGFAPNPVSGVGDEAFSSPDPNGKAGAAGASAFASYGALFGDTYIQIGGLTYVTPDQGKEIVEQLDSKL